MPALLTNGIQTGDKFTDGKFAHGNKIGNRFPAGTSGNRNGRPVKLTTTLQIQGYTPSQIYDIYSRIIALTVEEAQEIIDNPINTIIEQTLAKSAVIAANTGDLSILEQIVTRAFGKPKESIAIETTESPASRAAEFLNALLLESLKQLPELHDKARAIFNQQLLLDSGAGSEFPPEIIEIVARQIGETEATIED